MKEMDTGKIRLCIKEDKYLEVTIYTDGEIVIDDLTPVMTFFDQFDGPLPVMLHRQGRYSLSAEVQVMLWEEVGGYCKALVYIDHTRMGKRLTQLAKNTYMKNTEVESFEIEEDAAEWLIQFGGMPPVKHQANPLKTA